MDQEHDFDIPDGIFTEADRIAKLGGLPDASAVLVQCFVLCKQQYLQKLGLAEPMRREPNTWARGIKVDLTNLDGDNEPEGDEWTKVLDGIKKRCEPTLEDA